MEHQTSRRRLLSVSGGALLVKAETVRGAQANSALAVGLVGRGRGQQQFPRAQVYSRYEDLLAAAQKADPAKRIAGGFQHRYGKDYRKAYGIVKSGQTGAIGLIRAAWMAGDLPLRKGHPAAEEKMRNRVWYRETSGDIVVEQDCHNFDVVNWVMGAHPERVSGYGGRRTRTYGDNLDHARLPVARQGGGRDAAGQGLPHARSGRGAGRGAYKVRHHGRRATSPRGTARRRAARPVPGCVSRARTRPRLRPSA